MLIVVVLVFVISQTPALVTQALIALIADEITAAETCRHTFFFFYVRLSDLLVVANSSLNFIVYSFCSRRFRHILISLIMCRHTDDPVAVSGGRSHVTQGRRNGQGFGQHAASRLYTVRLSSLPLTAAALKLTDKRAVTLAPQYDSIDARLGHAISNSNILLNTDQTLHTERISSSPATMDDRN
jgi:hypothetical protein